MILTKLEKSIQINSKEGSNMETIEEKTKRKTYINMGRISFRHSGKLENDNHIERKVEPGGEDEGEA